MTENIQEQNLTHGIDHDPNEILYFAVTNYRNQRRKFGIKPEDRRRHVYIIGKTGMGKSNLMTNMIVQDIALGHGCCLVDPHGDDVKDILESIPSHRINDVIYFNPADLEYPIAFNILENVNPEHKHLVASGLMGVFTKIWANMWSARMEYILNNCLLALLDSPGTTLLGVNRLLVDKDYRKKIVGRIQDPIVKSFWVNEYANYNERFRTEAIAPIQNKVGQFLSSSVIRNIVGQTKSSIDLRGIMDEGKIMILDLTKGKIGEDNSSLLGAMMITKLQLAAMSRVDVPERQRRDFYLYVDEFQNFATTSFATILSEARKYRLNLIMGHQYIAQLDETVSPAVFGNVGTIICFRVGAPDAEELVKEFTPFFTEEDLVNLTKYDVYLKLMIDGVASKPFSATALPPTYKGKSTGNYEKVIKVSRERYSKPRAEVEEKILRWSGVEEVGKAIAESEDVNEEEAIFRDNIGRKIKTSSNNDNDQDEKRHAAINALRNTNKNNEQGTKAICDLCGENTVLNFEPDYSRNIFCRKCLKEMKENGLRPPRNLPLHNSSPKKENSTPVIATVIGSDQENSKKIHETREPRQEMRSVGRYLRSDNEQRTRDRSGKIQNNVIHQKTTLTSNKKITANEQKQIIDLSEKKLDKITDKKILGSDKPNNAVISLHQVITDLATKPDAETNQPAISLSDLSSTKPTSFKKIKDRGPKMVQPGEVVKLD